MAYDGVSIRVEYRNLVVAAYESFPTLVIEQNDVVGFFLLIVDRHSRAAFSEGFDDLARLGPSSTMCSTAKRIAGSAAAS